jgi:hypothetical protein
MVSPSARQLTIKFFPTSVAMGLATPSLLGKIIEAAHILIFMHSRSIHGVLVNGP